MVIYTRLPVWWNWQTHGTQNPAVAIPYRFDPDHRHQVYCNSVEHGVVFLYPAVLSVLARESATGYGKTKNPCLKVAINLVRTPKGAPGSVSRRRASRGVLLGVVIGGTGTIHIAI